MVREEKIKAVEEIINLLEKYSTIGLVDIAKMQSRQLQEIRKGIRNDAIIKVVKKSLLLKAMEKVRNKNLSDFKNYVPTQPALILSDLDPFLLYKKILELKSFTYAKENDIAPNDVWVRAGPTNLLPGPVISEFSKAGIPAGVEGGKIAIKKDTLVVKKGEKIPAAIANILRKLDMQIIEVFLNITSIYFNNSIYTKEVLELVKVYPEKVKECFEKALALSISISYPTKYNIEFLIAKAVNIAKCFELKSQNI